MNEGDKTLRILLSSEIKGDLLVLFHKNPGLIDTIDGVARRVGATTSGIETDVKDLVGLGLLGTRKIGKYEVLFLNRARDKEICDNVAECIKNMKIEGGT